MSVLILVGALIAIAILGAIIAVIAAVSGASAAIADEEDEEEISLQIMKEMGYHLRCSATYAILHKINMKCL